ncbi:MAG: HEAT repeat domain-containing protein, partial [Planctomycetota bacterium]
ALLALCHSTDERDVRTVLSAIADEITALEAKGAEFGPGTPHDIELLTHAERGGSEALLRAMARSDNAILRASAVYAVAPKMGDVRQNRRFMDLLLKASRDVDETVRAIATRALSQGVNPKGCDRLIEMLADESPRVRWQAAAALEVLGGDRAKEALEEFLGDRDVTRAAWDHWALLNEPDTETVGLLMIALERHGDIYMASDFLVAGDHALRSHARWWAERKRLVAEVSAEAGGEE